jgi:hypothetical protein
MFTTTVRKIALGVVLMAGVAFSQPNPYRTVEHWFTLPQGRTMGSTSSVFATRDGHVWVADRCGVNSCAGSPLDPIMEFDAKGKLLKAFGAGMFVFPHCLTFDSDGNLWVCDGQGKDGKGQQVFKLSKEGKVLMTLGKAGVAGDGPDTFDQPNSVAFAPNGDVFISDGHNAGRGNARVMKFSKDGKFIKQWAATAVDTGSSRCRTHWPSIRRAGCSWATAPTIAFRFSIRTVNFSTNGNSSAAQAGFLSIAKTSST